MNYMILKKNGQGYTGIREAGSLDD